jgi:hypothetical protein
VNHRHLFVNALNAECRWRESKRKRRRRRVTTATNPKLPSPILLTTDPSVIHGPHDLSEIMAPICVESETLFFSAPVIFS